ncbi:MAG: GHKL domain-containing protein, partial [Anaerolineae bacterium]|nr:GHKL domain-containing protein [Anaerolineae bacterium]
AYSRVGTRGKPFAPTNLETVLANVLIGLGPAIADAGATITHDPLPTIMADEGQMAQLLQNLLGNAIKFAREGTSPQVHVSAEARDEEWVFTVQDNGIGIEAQYFERIFIIFQRLHGKTEYSGTGIGLAICKRIIERHGGRIWLESEPGLGSTFTFTLPQPDASSAPGV